MGSSEDFCINLYDYVCDAMDDAEREEMLQPREVIEVGQYTRNRMPRGVALYCIVQYHLLDEGRGHCAEAYGLGHAGYAKNSVHAKHCGKMNDTKCQPRAMLHFCEAPRGQCCTHVEGHELVHVDLYRELDEHENVDEAGWPWLRDWIPSIDKKLEAIRAETLPHWRDLVDEEFFSRKLKDYQGEARKATRRKRRAEDVAMWSKCDQNAAY